MFEVIVTCRPDFREEVADRCPGLEEAQTIAERLSMQYPERFIRVWVRRSRRVETKCAKN
jgi:hypothetical protein